MPTTHNGAEGLRLMAHSGSEQTEQLMACPCGSRSVSLLEVKGRMRLIHCRDCSLLARYPMPDNSDLLRFYQDDYWSDNPAELQSTTRHTLFSHALDVIEGVTSPPGTLVDVGCGTGALLALSKERGWRGIGFDLSRKAVVRAREQGLEAHEQEWPLSSLSDESADAVTLVNVLDHLPNPFSALKKVWRVLRPGGALYIRVPNAPAHIALMKPLSWIGLGHLLVFHLFGFGRGCFQHHLPRQGFSILTIRTALPSQGEVSWKMSRSMAELRTFLKGVYRVGHRGLVGLGLDRQGWGLSLEVLASKRPQSGKQEAHP